MEQMIDQLPKKIRQKVKYLTKLTINHDVDKLRELRALSKDVKIDIYHHSAGTDSFFSDLEKRYFTWSELVRHSHQLMEDGATLYTGVIEYRPGVHFVSGSTAPDPSLN